MAQIATTTASDPLGVPANTRVDRDPATHYLYALVKSTTANTWDLYRSVDGGANWSLHLSLLRTGIQEMGSVLIPNDGYLYLSYRTNEGGQDRIYFRRCRLNNPIWGPETLTGNPAHGGTPGAIHQGMDIQLVDTRTRWNYIVIVVGTTFGGTSGVTLYGVLLDQPTGTHTYNNNFLTGRRQWMDITGTGRIVPSVDIEHDGSGKGSSTPHLWITYGRTELRTVKLSWTGAGWSGPGTTQLLQTGLAAQDGITGRWDGARWLMVVPHQTVTDTVLLVERNRGNTASTLRQSPAHPAGVIRTVGLSYSRISGRTASDATRVYAVGTANPDLHFVDYIRASGTWTDWSTVSTTDVIGTPPNQWSVRRGTSGNARHVVAIAHATPTPNTVVSYQQTVTYAPDTPTWDEWGIGYTNGSAANVASILALDWFFSDPDPNDSQSAWALSRQIGTGAIQYFRASDGTWQAAEVKNAGATTNRALAAGWGLTSDAPHGYKVKVWDSADTASLYSDAFVVLPSGNANPVITSPTEGQTITTDQVTVTWTAAEQTQYRVRLLIFGADLHDSGWRSGTDTSYQVPTVLTNTFSYSLLVQTRNLKGLASDAIQRNFSVAFVEPPRPSLAVAPQPAAGVIRVAISNPPAPSAGGSNPGFETGSTSAWTVVAGTIAAVQDVVKVGAWAGRLTADGTANPRVTHSQSATFVTAGSAYTISGWLYAPVALPSTASITIQWYTAAGAFVSQNVVSGTLTPGAWTYLEGTFTAPATAARAARQFSMNGTPAAGTLLYGDEINVLAAEPAFVSQEVWRRPVLTPILNANPSFEGGSTAGWGPAVGGTGAPSTEQAKSGGWSYKVIPDGVSGIAYAETVKLPCTEGVTYDAYGWVHAVTANKPTAVFLRWYNAGGGLLGATIATVLPPAAGVWRARSQLGIAPAGATQMTLCAGVGSTPAATDIVYVDELRIRVADPSDGIRVAAGLPSGAVVDDWRAVSGIDYEYRAVVRAANGASAFGPWTP